MKGFKDGNQYHELHLEAHWQSALEKVMHSGSAVASIGSSDIALVQLRSD